MVRSMDKALEDQRGRPPTPRKAITSACPMLVRAALAVRTFARIEMYMPIYPESAEQAAPSTKANVILRLVSQCFQNP